MSWGLVAVAGATVVGSVVSSKSASKAANKAAESNDAATLATLEQLDFAKQQYADWQATYGDIQENLSSYYSNLTPEYYAARGLEAFNQEQQASMTRIEQNLAQRGLGDSPLAASINAQSELNAAESRASIRAGAEDAVSQQRANFLSIGMGSNPSGSVSAAYQNMATVLGNQASQANQYAQNAAIASGQAWGNAVSTIGKSAADYFNSNPVTSGNTTAVNYQPTYYNQNVGGQVAYA